MTTASHDQATYCANHPDRETGLRCNRCEKLICTRCAQRTPTGYRCKECVSGHQRAFDTAEWYDFPIAFILAGGLSFLGSLLVTFVGFFMVLVGPAAGGIIAEAVRFVVKRRRSRNLFLFTLAAIILGGSLLFISALIPAIGSLAVVGAQGLGFFYPLIWHVVYLFLATSTAYYRLSGIRIK